MLGSAYAGPERANAESRAFSRRLPTPVVSTERSEWRTLLPVGGEMMGEGAPGLGTVRSSRPAGRGQRGFVRSRGFLQTSAVQG